MTLELGPVRFEALTALLQSWARHRRGPDGEPLPESGPLGPTVEVLWADVLHPGRPGVIGVVARVEDRVAHAVLGVRSPGDEPHFLRPGEDVALGVYEDADGLGVVVDALNDAELGALVAAHVLGDEVPGVATLVAQDAERTVLGFGDRCTLCIYTWPIQGTRPSVAFLAGLDDAGFNHIAAPLQHWKVEGWELGLALEAHPGAAPGRAVALTSLRDLFGFGGPPERAGGDFAGEAAALGVMTARMHLALDRAFGRVNGDVATSAAALEELVARAHPSLVEPAAAAMAFERLRKTVLHVATLRVHGDYGLSKVARTDQGWILAYPAPGAERTDAAFVMASPLTDVAAFLDSLHRLAIASARERDPSGRLGLEALARAWEERNGRAYLDAYLSTPGIRGIVPSDDTVVRDLLVVHRLERTVERLQRHAREGETQLGTTTGSGL
jgi:maltokinase